MQRKVRREPHISNRKEKTRLSIGQPLKFGLALMLSLVLLWFAVSSFPSKLSDKVEAFYGGTKEAVAAARNTTGKATATATGQAVVVKAETFAEFPHDHKAFTQGLQFYKGVLYESTGLYGESSLRKVELETGKVLQRYDLPKNLFGEGLVVFNDTIWLLTWREHKVLVLHYQTFELLETLRWPLEGWGICHNRKHFIVSVGTHILYFVSFKGFRIIKQVPVIDVKNGKHRKVKHLNELEYINGMVYANVWYKTDIAVIDPETGRVVQWLDYKHLAGTPGDVMNGIAFHRQSGKVYLTGKLWPKLLETRLPPLPAGYGENQSIVSTQSLGTRRQADLLHQI
eukprot:gb/GEZN01009802.1/.p1 GENE.gb/GEZN01009802.1/~~gb/GEZN01009802.1/.p1  ORF type:complete len:341 (+),score=35.99 gb/GEZN01009802.1/:128-1150(+)